MSNFLKAQHSVNNLLIILMWLIFILGIKRIGNSSQIKVTKMLLIVSTVFVCLNLPSYAMRIKAFLISDVSQRKTNTHTHTTKKKYPIMWIHILKGSKIGFYNFIKSNLFPNNVFLLVDI